VAVEDNSNVAVVCGNVAVVWWQCGCGRQ